MTKTLLLPLSALILALGAPLAHAASGASCKSTGSVSVSSTIKVVATTFDGGCKTFNATSALGDGSQGEAQKAVFRIQDGGTLKNVIIGTNGADGVHVWNGGTADNVTWLDVGEDAFSIKKPGNVTVRNITGSKADDKFFQVNAEGTLTVSNCVIDGAAKAYRQNGGKTWKAVVNMDNCDLSNMKEGVFRTDSPVSTAKLTNSRTRNVPTVCIGYASGKCTSSNVKTF